MDTFYFYPTDKHGKKLGHSITIIIKDGKPFVGYAQLGKGDTFNKKIGRSIAEFRARQQLEKYDIIRKKITKTSILDDKTISS